MKRNLSGVGTVFRYTLQQHYKTTSVRILLLVLFVIALAAFPVAMMLHGKDAEVTDTKIKTLYLRNESGFAIDAAEVRADSRYAEMGVTETSDDDEALAKTLSKDPNAAAAVIKMDDMKGFVINGFYGEKGEVTEADISTLNGLLEDALRNAQYRALGVNAEQVAMIGSRSYTTVLRANEFKSGSVQTDANTHAFVNLAYSYMVLLLITLAMSYIFQLCMEEKVSKLVESLLVSVSPTALLVGKILAVTCFLFGGIALIVIGLVISWNIAKGMGDTAFISEGVTKFLGFDPAVLNIGIGTVLLLILCVLLAYGTGAFYSGICGSLCSKTEDTQQASIAVVLFVMIGYMSASMAPMFQSDGANTFLSIFPLTSIFIALPNYICGKIGLPVFLTALAVQLLTVFLLARLAGRVYRMMLLYRGGVPKPKQLIAMLKDARRDEKRAAGKEGSHGNEA